MHFVDNVVGKTFEKMMQDKEAYASFVEGWDRDGHSIVVRMDDAVKALVSAYPALAEKMSPNHVSDLILRHLWIQQMVVAPMVNNRLSPSTLWRVRRGTKTIGNLARISLKILGHDVALDEITERMEPEGGLFRSVAEDEATA